MNSIFANCDVISTYTRQNAIDDGILIELTSLCPDICHQLYKYSLAVTSEVWSIIDKAVSSKNHGNDLETVIWDILWMSQRGIIKRIDESQHLFEVIITGADREVHTFKVICHPGDNAEPVLTIMMPWED